jgi:hypothetical protein
MQDLEQTIRERAYHLWVEGGCGHGNADAHWLAAQREILSVSLGELGRVTAGEAKAEKPKRARAPRKRRAA